MDNMKKFGDDISPCRSSISTSDEEWIEFERELDDQVNAVFQMGKGIQDSAAGSKNFSCFDPSQNLSLFQIMDDLNEKVRKRKQRRRTVIPILVAILAGSMIFGRFVTPGMWIKKSYCESASMNDALCSQCYGQWPWHEEWIYCLAF